MKVNPNLKNMPTTSLPQCPLFVLFMLHQQIIQTSPEGKCQYTVENGRTPRRSTRGYDPNMSSTISNSKDGLEFESFQQPLMWDFCDSTSWCWILKGYFGHPRCILYPSYHLRWWAVKRIILGLGMEKHMASKNKWPVSLI